MRFLKEFLLVSLLLISISKLSSAHGASGITATLTTNPASPVPNQEVQLSFTLKTDEGLDINYVDLTDTKVMHLYGIRNDLTNYLHLHPSNTTTGVFQIPYT